MTYVQGQNRKQKILLPDCIEDLISQENPVRVIDAFVDALDMDEMGFQRAVPNNTGRPGYDPRDLLKLFVYGYFNRIRSSRKLMAECGRNIEVFFLLNRLIPDFRTISDFRKDNSKAIRLVFKAFVRLCLKLNLYEKELLAIDGSKFRAVNSKDNAYNAEILNKKLDRIDEHISEYLSRMDSTDEIDTDKSDDTENVRQAIEELTQRKDKYQGYLDELNETGKTQILTTDPEAHRMHSKDGFHCCYNVQTAVDRGSHLIAEYEVTNNCGDQGLLRKTAELAREALDVETIEVVADKGYESRADILDCVMNGIVPNVAIKYDKHERLFTIEHEENQISETERQSTSPDDIQKCLHAGILPACYENTSIEIEVQGKSTLSCFILNDDGTVTCPMGNTLKKLRIRKNNCTIYGSKDACRQCTNKCTGSSKHKTVSFGPNTRFVPVRMFGKSNHNFTKIPEDIPMNPFNHTLDTKKQPDKKVVIKIKEDIPKIKERMCLSEHPFGTVKWYDGAHYLLCKGKEKVSAELGLSFLSYNLKRAINMVGTKKLIEAIQG